MDAAVQKALDETTVIVVAYNSAGVIEACLAPFCGARAVIVVDNASGDDSPARAAAACPGARIVRNAENVGYGRAMNQAMTLVETPYALHLNPDAVLSPETLARLHTAAEANGARAAIVAPVLYTPKGEPELHAIGPGGRNYGPITPTPEGDFCTWSATGAVWLCRTAAWRALGGFDENIFLYHEDLDFCRRARAEEFAILVVPEARGAHLISRSTPPSARIRWRKEWNIVWGHLYLERKFRGGAAAHAEAWRIIRKRVPKAVFYALVFRPKRFLRDLAISHAAVSFLLGIRPVPARDADAAGGAAVDLPEK
ncbi:MAG: glycosyltransferase family 2 protein [Pseudomonadota bacterium]